MEQELYLKQMPYSAEAEMSVLGSVVIDPGCFDEIAAVVRSQDFYIPQNQELFLVLTEMYNASETIDFVTFSEKLKTRGIYNDVGGREYLMRLVDIVPTTLNVKHYAQIVAQKSSLRRLLVACDEIGALCYGGADDATDVIDIAEQKIYAIAQNRNMSEFSTAKEVILRTYDRLSRLVTDKESVMGRPSGFASLDKILIGLNNSDLILVAGRPGMGKTSFALNLARNIAVESKKDVAIFSLEMSKEQLIERMLSSEALLDGYKLRTGELSDEDWKSLAMAAGVLSASHLYLDDTSSITVTEMKAKCRRLKNLGLIVIDYLQLMQSPSRKENRVQEVADISRSLKIMAKELNVPVVCLSQLSRAPESRPSKRPMLSDLRESGAIEQDADIVLFLYREDYYNPETEKKNIAECIVSKNRHGSTGTAEFVWNGQVTRFTSLEKQHNA